MAKFMEEHDLKDAKQLPLGFTFSFPCRQEGLTSAKVRLLRSTVDKIEIAVDQLDQRIQC